jgi:release factor glutamine methyltransferase
LLGGLAEPRILDVGVGSGAIALAIADEHPGARVIATDSSGGALVVAAENRARAGLDDRVQLLPGELFAGLDGPFDLVVSNPPYVNHDELNRLEPEVARFEPRRAIVASGVTEAVADGALERLSPGGALVLETADGRAHEIAELLDQLGYERVTITNDLTGRERVVDGIAHG